MKKNDKNRLQMNLKKIKFVHDKTEQKEPLKHNSRKQKQQQQQQRQPKQLIIVYDCKHKRLQHDATGSLLLFLCLKNSCNHFNLQKIKK